MVRESYERITWAPILGRYKFSWLRIRPKRRNWGYDWWEDDYYFSMEWLAMYHSSFVDQEVTDYWHNVLEDFSRGSKPDLWYENAKNFKPSKLSAYQQPLFFKTFYWQCVKPFEGRYLQLIDPYILGLATISHELKYTHFIPGFVFRRTRWIFMPGMDPQDVFAYSPCYVFGRADVSESSIDYLYMDTLVGRFVSSYWPWLTEFLARFFLDFQNVSFVSFWIDMRYRGFSPVMLLTRWRYYYALLTNFTYIELYTLPFFFWQLSLHKRATTLWLLVIFLGGDLAGVFGGHKQMRDRSHDSDNDVLALNRDEPGDPILSELYDPSDPLYTYLAHGVNAGNVGQPDLSAMARSHYSAPMLLTSWRASTSTNESLAHFIYRAERDFIGNRRARFIIFLSRLLKKKWPKLHAELVRRKIPGFRTYTFLGDRFLRRYFGWWLRWRWHGWFWWGRRPLSLMADRYATFSGLYNFCMGIEFYIQRYEARWLSLRNEIYDHIFHDWGVSVQDDEDARIILVCYGRPSFGYVD